MLVVELDSARMDTRPAAHAYLREKLDLPDYYGENLDALFDCLTEAGTPRRLVLCGASVLRKNLGEYGELLARVLAEAAKANPSLEVVVLD